MCSGAQKPLHDQKQVAAVLERRLQGSHGSLFVALRGLGAPTEVGPDSKPRLRICPKRQPSLFVALGRLGAEEFDGCIIVEPAEGDDVTPPPVQRSRPQSASAGRPGGLPRSHCGLEDAKRTADVVAAADAAVAASAVPSRRRPASAMASLRGTEAVVAPRSRPASSGRTASAMAMQRSTSPSVAHEGTEAVVAPRARPASASTARTTSAMVAHQSASPSQAHTGTVAPLASVTRPASASAARRSTSARRIAAGGVGGALEATGPATTKQQSLPRSQQEEQQLVRQHSRQQAQQQASGSSQDIPLRQAPSHERPVDPVRPPRPEQPQVNHAHTRSARCGERGSAHCQEPCRRAASLPAFHRTMAAKAAASSKPECLAKEKQEEDDDEVCMSLSTAIALRALASSRKDPEEQRQYCEHLSKPPRWHQKEESAPQKATPSTAHVALQREACARLSQPWSADPSAGAAEQEYHAWVDRAAQLLETLEQGDLERVQRPPPGEPLVSEDSASMSWMYSPDISWEAASGKPDTGLQEGAGAQEAMLSGSIGVQTGLVGWQLARGRIPVMAPALLDVLDPLC